MKQKVRYEAIDGLKSYAILGVVLVHVQANLPKYIIDYSPVIKEIIQTVGWCICLFFMLSAFSLCCGYYEKFKQKTVSPNDFYARRYQRGWPFFAMLVLIELALNRDMNTLYESFADLTLCFFLLPNPNNSVIGVGWFQGIIFLFYMLFPFFVFLFDNKKRGWFVLVLSLIFCYCAVSYFFTSKFIQPAPEGDFYLNFNYHHNMIYIFPYFAVGGMLYLYRDKLYEFSKNHQLLTFIIYAVIYIGFYLLENYTALSFRGWFLRLVRLCIVLAALVTFCLGANNNVLLVNKFAKYINSISMEIYLCHMMFFRVVDMIHLEKFISNHLLLYFTYCVIVIACASAFSHVIKFYVFPKVLPLIGIEDKKK